jgi:hypothetical protein
LVAAWLLASTKTHASTEKAPDEPEIDSARPKIALYLEEPSSAAIKLTAVFVALGAGKYALTTPSKDLTEGAFEEHSGVMDSGQPNDVTSPLASLVHWEPGAWALSPVLSDDPMLLIEIARSFAFLMPGRGVEEGDFVLQALANERWTFS